MSFNQFVYLFKRDLQAARRTRGIMIITILMPILMWGFNIILPLIRITIINETSALISTNQAVKTIVNPLDVSIDLGMPIMIAIMLTFLSVLPYVTASIAGERERNTIEALLSLPISRHQILMTKFAAGAVIGLISTLINLICMWLYIFITNNVIAPANNWTSDIFNLNLNLQIFLPLALTLSLCMLLNLGIGISLASIFKSAETSRQVFTILLIPIMIVITVTLFTGVPEVLSASINSQIPLLLYFIPWMHVIAISQKLLIPEYFSINSLYVIPLESVIIDVIFHLTTIIAFLVFVIWIASKFFAREGLVN